MRSPVFVALCAAALLGVLPSEGASAQPVANTEAEVRGAVVRLFDGMRAGDSAAVRAAFHPQARLFSVVREGEGHRVVESEIDGFVALVGAPHDAIYDERVDSVDVRLDDGLATAWMGYRFYVGPTFSHCGVNSFQLVRTDAGWQAIAIADTRRAACDEPAPPDVAAEAGVRATLVGLFDAMRAADTAAVRAAFHPEARLVAVVRDGEEHRLRVRGVEDFVAAVAESGGAPLDERVDDIEVRLDDGLAVARMGYRFYVGGRFSHCGVDDVQLVRTDGNWKILSFAFTAREGCD